MSDSESYFGDLRALMHRGPSLARWRRLLAMLRAWPDAGQRMREVVPYVSSHLREWPISWRALDPDQILLCDQATSEVMLRRWNSSYSDILPLVPDDAQWLRDVIAHLDYDVRYAVKLQPLIHAGAFSRVRSAALYHHDNPRDFLEKLSRVFAVRGPGVKLERLVLESCFFHQESAELLERLVDVSSVRTLKLNHSLKPSAVSMLCDEAWAGVEHLELTGDLLRLEDVRVMLQSEMCKGLTSLRLGYLLDARGEEVQPLVRELSELLEEGATRIKTLALPGLHLTGRAMTQLAQSEGVREVRALDLRDNILGEEAMRALCAPDAKFERLEHLRLGQWLIRDDLVDMLMRSPLASRLKTLDVMRCDLNPLTHVSLLSREHMPALERLGLSGVRMSRALFERVARASRDEGGLTTLVLDQAECAQGEEIEEIVRSSAGRWWRAIAQIEVSPRQERMARFASSWVELLREASPGASFDITPAGERPERLMASVM